MTSLNKHGVDITKIHTGDTVTLELTVGNSDNSQLLGWKDGVNSGWVRRDQVTSHTPKPIQLTIGMRFIPFGGTEAVILGLHDGQVWVKFRDNSQGVYPESSVKLWTERNGEIK